MRTDTSIAKRAWPEATVSGACGASGLLCLLLALPATVEAQFTCTTNAGALTITGYTGSGGAVEIPSTINGLPVTAIGDNAFYGSSNLTSVAIGNSVTGIGGYSFASCSSLTNVLVGSAVTSIGICAFFSCPSLARVYFQGNAPSLGPGAFNHDTIAVVYYLPGTSGWGSTFGNPPTALWTPRVQTGDASCGVRANQFGFNINWAGGMTVVVEASTSLINPAWSPLATNTLAGSSLYFSDPQWTNYPARFYRLRWP
jgi:hypothetical protein